jgi:hypothetical protein
MQFAQLCNLSTTAYFLGGFRSHESQKTVDLTKYHEEVFCILEKMNLPAAKSFGKQLKKFKNLHF